MKVEVIFSFMSENRIFFKKVEAKAAVRKLKAKTQCLKITKKVAFKFCHFPLIFGLFFAIFVHSIARDVE